MDNQRITDAVIAVQNNEAEDNANFVAVGIHSDKITYYVEWEDLKEIDAGYKHTVGLKKDGTVIAVGYKEDGQCDVNNWKDIKSIYAGGNSTFGIK